MTRFFSDWRKPARFALAIIFAIGLVAVFLNRDAIGAAEIIEWSRRHALWETLLAFLGLHILASLFFIPRLFLGLAAGALFGVWMGTIVAIIGATLGGLAGFWIVRFVSSDTVHVEETPTIGPWLEKAEAFGWRFVLVVRLIPVLPHSLINYVFGLSRVTTLGYVIGSALGMLPTAIIYVNMGATGAEILSGRTQDYALLAVWGFGLLFISWFLPRLIRRFFPDM
ncbi:MAG: TVP38/TMEM64 family protein [Alphaproteobacteria bacterium]|nr:TVP38/TMEM64 family protein [Alphaproteobacteria bacterium]